MSAGPRQPSIRHTEFEPVSDIFSSFSTLVREKRELEEANRRLELEVRRLERLVYLDPLTGLGNRRHFDAVLESEMARAARRCEPLTLLICDVDRFKSCNDRHGHAAGDRLLVEVGRILTAHCRRGGDLAVRFAGDEFALLLPGVPQAGAAPIADRLRAATRALGFGALRCPHDCRVSISIGGASAVPGSEACEPAALVARADEALYRAKQAGRNRAFFADRGHDTQAGA